jgi:hypothetical protein
MDSDRTPLGKGKDVLHGAARAVPLRQSVEQPWGEGGSGGLSRESGRIVLMTEPQLLFTEAEWNAAVPKVIRPMYETTCRMAQNPHSPVGDETEAE